LCSDIPQRLRSHKTFKGQRTHARVRTITYLFIDGLPYNLVQMLRLCAVILIWVHTSKVKVTQHI